MSQSTTEIPVVDLSDISSPRSEVRAHAAAQIRRAFGHFGLIYIRNHGVDMERLEAFYDAYLEFCAQPEAEKQKMSTPSIWYQRGWTPPNTEKAVVAGGQPDFKECYFVTPEDPSEELQREYPELYAKNIWPEDAPEFKEHYIELSRQLQQVAAHLMRGSALALGLAPHTLEGAVDGGPHVTRALRYIPLTTD